MLGGDFGKTCGPMGPYFGKKFGPIELIRGPVELTQHLQNLPNTFRIYPTPSEFTQHLLILPNPFIFYPTPSEFTNPFRFYPTPSEFTHHLQNLPTTFRIHPPPSEKIGVGAVGPFWTFFLKSQDPKNVNFDKNDFCWKKILKK